MNWSVISKLFIGLLLALSLIAGGGLVAARIIQAKLTTLPPKPVYPNDKPSPIASKSKSANSTTVAKAEKTDAEAPAKSLPAGSTPGRVTQPIGLILRDSPNGGQVGGVEYNDRVVVLETSQDGGWQKVRLQSTDKEGWVKSGNIEQVNQ